MTLLTSLLVLALQSPGTLEVTELGEAPARKITVTSAGVHRAVLWNRRRKSNAQNREVTGRLLLLEGTASE